MSLPFKSPLNIWKFMVHILLKPSLEGFEHYFASVWYEYNCAVECKKCILWHFLSLGLEWKLSFSSPVAAEFSKFAGILSGSTFTVSSFRIWNSSTGIPSPPLALFIVILSEAHLTSHSRMSGSKWVITALWLSGSWWSFLYSSSVL